MGTLICTRCRAKTEADSIEEGRKRLNHAIGLVLGKPCYDGLGRLSFIGEEKPVEKQDTKEKSETIEKESPKEKVTKKTKKKIKEKQ